MISNPLDIHPSSDQLAAFALGHLDDCDATPIADHLGSCETCQQAVLSVPDDSVLSLLRSSGGTPVPKSTLKTSLFVHEEIVPPELRDHARYRVLRRLGAGGMGVVYQAEHRLMDRTVALKVINKELTVTPGVIERFQREVRAAARLAHPNLVQAYDAEKAGDLHFLVLEFIDGETLAALVKRDGPWPVDRACDVIRQAALGLAHAAEQGLVHRDVKPQNIMVTGQGQVKVMDFGLASLNADRGGQGGLTDTGQGMGTPDYMAPEQIRDARTADARADIYSLGCTFYFLLTSRPPFPDGDANQKMAAHLEKQPTPLAQLRPDLPAALVQVVERMMAKDAAKRYQSAAAVVAALEPWCPPAGKRSTPQPGVGGRWIKTLAIAVAIIVVVGMVLAYFYAPSNERSGPQDDAGRIVEGKKGPLEIPSPQPMPREAGVLTVSQKPEDGGQFRTITEALINVEPGMTIRVLDDAVYQEELVVAGTSHRRVVLDGGGKASIRRPPGRSQAVSIHNVSDFMLRGFRFDVPADNRSKDAQVFIKGHCPGVRLDRLDITGTSQCVDLMDVRLTDKDAPVVIQNCTLRGADVGVEVEGRDRENPDRPLPSGQVVIRDNKMDACVQGVFLDGVVHKVHVVGNRILNTRFAAIDLCDFLPGTADILVANNTVWRIGAGLRVWDDHRKGKDFLKCKNIRFQNNLVLEPREFDLVFLDHDRGTYDETRRPDLPALLKLLERGAWRFSHNWRETADRLPGYWIPGPKDHLHKAEEIKLLSRKPSDPDFLRPAKDSPLASGGVNDGILPAYVGAVPPLGTEPWDWNITWQEFASVRPGDPAPDLSKVAPLYADNFSDPDRSYIPALLLKQTMNEWCYEKGRLILKRGPNVNNIFCATGCFVEGDFAVEAVGRAAADDRSWGVGLNDPAGDRALAVCLGRDGTLEVGDFPFGRRSPAMAGIKKLQHPAIRPGNERNTLMLILRGGRSLEIYANGTSVSRPIQLIRLLLGQELGAQWHVAKSIWRGAAIEGDVACQAVGKVLSDRDVGWKVGFATTKRDKDDVAVLVRRDGGVEICNLFTYPPTTILGPIRHPAIKPGNEDNKVLAVLRGGQTLEVYVNDQAICAPITLREPLPSVVPGIGLWERCGAPELKGRAEFSSLKLWKLPGS